MAGLYFLKYQYYMVYGILVIGIVLLAWSIYGDPARGRLRCPYCWYNMQGAPALVCPECGRNARTQRRLKKRRIRKKWGMLAVAMLFGSYTIHIAHDVRARGWPAAIPTPALVAVSPFLVTDRPVTPYHTSSAKGLPARFIAELGYRLFQNSQQRRMSLIERRALGYIAARMITHNPTAYPRPLFNHGYRLGAHYIAQWMFENDMFTSGELDILMRRALERIIGVRLLQPDAAAAPALHLFDHRRGWTGPEAFSAPTAELRFNHLGLLNIRTRHVAIRVSDPYATDPMIIELKNCGGQGHYSPWWDGLLLLRWPDLSVRDVHVDVLTMPCGYDHPPRTMFDTTDLEPYTQLWSGVLTSHASKVTHSAIPVHDPKLDTMIGSMTPPKLLHIEQYHGFDYLMFDHAATSAIRRARPGVTLAFTIEILRNDILVAEGVCWWGDPEEDGRTVLYPIPWVGGFINNQHYIPLVVYPGYAEPVTGPVVQDSWVAKIVGNRAAAVRNPTAEKFWEGEVVFKISPPVQISYSNR